MTNDERLFLIADKFERIAEIARGHGDNLETLAGIDYKKELEKDGAELSLGTCYMLHMAIGQMAAALGRGREFALQTVDALAEAILACDPDLKRERNDEKE